jgi:hypothetical protein
LDKDRQDRIAQWAFDTRPILGRFHLWLEAVEERWQGKGWLGAPSFVGPALERAFIVAAAVTALGTRLFGRYGEGRGLDKAAVNQVKKDADAISAYALSEAIWYLTRNLPENHALMVSLGEGLMPKLGETPEMGANPLLGFGRIYARPGVARALDRRVQRLINDPGYGWEEFWSEVQQAGITLWGAAVDTLENTSRFARGEPTGPMTVLHLYDQPLRVAAPYEGYVGTLVLPRRVIDAAMAESVLIGYHTPRRQVLAMIRRAYPDVAAERVWVWTLGGASREARLGGLWREWRELGVRLVEDGEELPGGGPAFTESGTYAPVFRVGPFRDREGRDCLFLCDGYAASAEAIQAASLDPVLDLATCLCPFSSRFQLPVERERRVMRLDAGAPGFTDDLAAVAGGPLAPALVADYRDSLVAAHAAGIPLAAHDLTVDDFFPRKSWRVLALAGFMLPDPYGGGAGVEEVGEGVYRVTVRAATRDRLGEVDLTLRLSEGPAASRLIFSPLLDRFYAGYDHRRRPVKISDSGRIRNELETLCSVGLEHCGDGRLRLHFDRISDGVLPAAKKAKIREVLAWYKTHHPVWFSWLDVAD